MSVTRSSAFQITYNVLIAAQNVAMSAPHTEAFANARGAAAEIFKILERTPKIDSMNSKGKTPKDKLGEVVMDDVHFNYPSRPDVRVGYMYLLNTLPVFV